MLTVDGGGGGKPKACATALEQWDEVKLKSGEKIPLLQEHKFCAEADIYLEAQKTAEAQAKAFLDKIEAKKAAKENEARQELKRLENEYMFGPKF